MMPRSGWERVRASARAARQAWRIIFGVPDYAAYLEHMRRTHPGEPPLAQGEFFAWALERRHAGRGPRCC
jgi:uncharacterized short protein YbdD (DUF466 family)